jgi:uncharacterized protein
VTAVADRAVADRAVADRVAPVPTPETQPFWDGCRERTLRVQRCDRCERHFFYPRVSCPTCGSAAQVRWVEASGRATLHSYVISHIPAPGYEPPFVIAIVQLDEGPRLLTNIVGVAAEPGALVLDMPLGVDFEPRGDLAVPVFRPAQPSAA